MPTTRDRGKLPHTSFKNKSCSLEGSPTPQWHMSSLASDRYAEAQVGGECKGSRLILILSRYDATTTPLLRIGLRIGSQISAEGTPSFATESHGSTGPITPNPALAMRTYPSQVTSEDSVLLGHRPALIFESQRGGVNACLFMPLQFF